MNHQLTLHEQQSFRQLANSKGASPMIRAMARRRLETDKQLNLALHGIHNLHVA
jgi:hypothetical protein